MKFDLSKIQTAAIQAGVVAGALIGAHTVKKLLMEPRGEKKSIIPDSMPLNLVVTAGAVYGASVTKGNISLLLSGVAAFFFIRVINKSTKSLEGLGNPTANRLQAAISPWIPNLGNVANADDSDVAMIMRRAVEIAPSPMMELEAQRSGDFPIETSNPVLVGVSQSALFLS